MGAFVTEAIGDSTSLPVKRLLRTTCERAGGCRPAGAPQAWKFPKKRNQRCGEVEQALLRGSIDRVDEAVASRQRERLAKLRSRRDQERAKRSLDLLRSAAKGQENLIPHIFASVKALATLGEISDALREVFGEQREQVAV